MIPSPNACCYQMKRVLPIMHERIVRIIPDDNSDIAAAAVVRIAVCHYVIGGDSPDRFLAELRDAGQDQQPFLIKRKGIGWGDQPVLTRVILENSGGVGHQDSPRLARRYKTGAPPPAIRNPGSAPRAKHFMSVASSRA